MEPLDPRLVPAPSGLANPGALCYLNSLLQLLLGCTSFSRAALRLAAASVGKNAAANPTALAVGRFVAAALRGGRQGPTGVHAALGRELARRGVRFGDGQESASEALVHLLAALGSEEVDRLFTLRQRCELTCRGCGRGTVLVDHATVCDLFHVDSMRDPPRTPEEFSRALLNQVSVVADYACEKCRRRGAALRVYSLTMAPEILVCRFNAYAGPVAARYFPPEFTLPAVDGGRLRYRAVARVEHSGSLGGGHYVACALRRGQKAELRAYTLDDTRVDAAGDEIRPTPNTYLVAYHFVAS